MEADLARFYGADYRDRWRVDADGCVKLTLRMILVRVQHLPLDAVSVRLLNDNKVPWSRTEHLLDELRRRLDALGGDKRPKPDPDRLPPKEEPKLDPVRVRKRNEALARLRERTRLIETGEIK